MRPLDNLLITEVEVVRTILPSMVGTEASRIRTTLPSQRIRQIDVDYHLCPKSFSGWNDLESISSLFTLQSRIW